MRPADEPRPHPVFRCRMLSAALLAAMAAGVVAAPQPDGVDIPADLHAQTVAAASQLTIYLNDVGRWQLARRAATIAAIRTREEAERRQATVRAKILALVGGAVTTGRAENVRPFATVADEGFRIENTVASFITSFGELLPGRGPQDAEQTLPSFIASELDFADWVALAAPRPFAIVAFEDDFLPVTGARATYAEARRFYAHFSAETNLRYIEGRGGHCNLEPVAPQVVEFLLTHLTGPDATVSPFTTTRPKDADTLTVTPTGQVSTSLAARSVEDLTRERATTRLPPLASPPSTSEDIVRHRARVQEDVRLLAGVVASPGMEGPLGVATFRRQFDGYRVEDVILESEPGITLTGMIGVPDGSGQKPAVIWMDAAPHEHTIATPEFVRLVRSGRIVFGFHPRGVLGEPSATSSPLALGPYMPLLLRAILVGKTIVGMRTDDVVRATDWLMTRRDVDRSSVMLYGTGAQGMVALHAAVLDRRITAVTAENTLVSYRAVLDANLHRDLLEVLIPGVLTRYDVPNLLQAIGPRPVWLVNPADAMGQPLPESQAREALGAAFEADRAVGATGRIHLVRRTGRDPLPIP